jgi:hypothetical protein
MAARNNERYVMFPRMADETQSAPGTRAPPSNQNG